MSYPLIWMSLTLILRAAKITPNGRWLLKTKLTELGLALVISTERYAF